VVDDSAEKGIVTTDMENGALDVATDVQPVVVETPAEKKAREKEERRKLRRERKAREKDEKAREAAAASGGSQHTSSLDDEPAPELVVGDELAALNGRAASPYPPSHRPEDENVDAGHLDTIIFPLPKLASYPQLLANMLSYFSLWDWCTLSSVTKEIRILLVQKKELRDEVLERYLTTVGYLRWAWSEEREPLSLSLQVCFVAVFFHFSLRVAYSGPCGLYERRLDPITRICTSGEDVRAFVDDASQYTRSPAGAYCQVPYSDCSGLYARYAPPPCSGREGSEPRELVFFWRKVRVDSSICIDSEWVGEWWCRWYQRVLWRYDLEARFTSYESRTVTHMSNFSHSHSYSTTPNAAKRDVPRSWFVAIDGFPITAVPIEEGTGT
jgi:hypothetical protein